MNILTIFYYRLQLKSAFKGRGVEHCGSILWENKSIKKEKLLAIDQMTSLRTLYLVADLFGIQLLKLNKHFSDNISSLIITSRVVLVALKYYIKSSSVIPTTLKGRLFLFLNNVLFKYLQIYIYIFL